jgi:hypothetical protein
MMQTLSYTVSLLAQLDNETIIHLQTTRLVKT